MQHDMLKFLLLTAAAIVFADDAICSLQKLRYFGATLDSDDSASRLLRQEVSEPGDFWSMESPRGCKRPAKTQLQVLQVFESQELTPKPTCLQGEALIGDFVQGVYKFSCCKAGEQCGGCRAVKNGVCEQCAAGYVMQTMPIVNTSKCFLCDDIPNWHDMQGRTCADLQRLGICSGSWPQRTQDVAFQGLRPSEACCACGGGSIYPTPVYMPLQTKSLYFGQNINETPDPMTAQMVKVAPGCTFASSGLELLSDGSVKGVVTVKNQTVIKCSTVSVQDPVRGIMTSINFSMPVSSFSYGEQVVHFKFWGLDLNPAQRIVAPQSAHPTDLMNFKLQCDPECPWLSITSSGQLHWNPVAPPTPPQPSSALPQDLKSQTTALPKMPSCSCQVLATTSFRPALNFSRWPKRRQRALATLQTPVATQFLVAQARLWKGGVWEMPKIKARISEAITEVPLREDLGPGLRWYKVTGHSLQVPVVENISTGEKFIVSESIPPGILDVNCQDGEGSTLTWSRISGEVMLAGETAFKLDPFTGVISGTPHLTLSATQGRAEVNITCQVALGGRLYDQALPVAVLNVHILDDVCWVPSNISGTFRWNETRNVKEAQCLQECRLADDCAAVLYEAGICKILVSDGAAEKVESQVLVRLNNCSEMETSLNLTISAAEYLQGEFSVLNVFQDETNLAFQSNLLVSYSRPGTNPQRQLVLARREVVERAPVSCAKSTWMLLHINSSDYEDAESKTAPEFFGNPMACITSEVVGNAFKNGQDSFDLQILPAELHSQLQQLQAMPAPPAVLHGTLALAVPSCPKPTENFVFGTVNEPGIYSLHACDCFGEAYAAVPPVDPASNAAVPRNANNYFNNGSVPDQKLFSGPYTCEESASVAHFLHMDVEGCQKACASEPECQFYLFGKTSETCTLFQSCNYVQDVGLQIVNELYGIPPENASYCRIASPQKCWQEAKRRSMLSFTPSNIPKCLFQEQYDACDALQLLLGKQDGPCTRCQYIDISSPFAASGLKKIPSPQLFSPASQISVTCNETSRMFARLQDGLQWDGPRQTAATFTCVSGEWVGELGPWRYLSNFTCERCIEVGSSSLQRLSLVSMPEIYFLEHRQVHVNYPFAINGCARAGILTASPLQSFSNMFLDVAKDMKLQLSQKVTGATWWLDAATDQLRMASDILDGLTEWCVCMAKELAACPCSPSEKDISVVIQGGLLESNGTCAKADAGALSLAPCPEDRNSKQSQGFLWHFESGNCFFGFDMSDTAEKLWVATSEAPSGAPVHLGNFAFKSSPSGGGGLFQMYMDRAPFSDMLCLHANLSLPVKLGYSMQVSTDCRSVFMWRGDHLAYFHHGNFNTTYYLLVSGDPADPKIGFGLLTATETASPDPHYRFALAKGKLTSIAWPGYSVEADFTQAMVPAQNPTPVSCPFFSDQSVVISPSPPSYPPCQTLGAFVGHSVASGTYYQECRESALFQLGTTSGAEVEEYINMFWFKCPGDAVLSRVSWYSWLPPMGSSESMKGGATIECSSVGVQYVKRAPNYAQKTYQAAYDPTTRLLNFTCPPGTLINTLQFSANKTSDNLVICVGPWLSEIAPAPSGPITPSFQFDENGPAGTQHWAMRNEKLLRTSSRAWMELESCEASLSVPMDSNPNPNADAEPLNLTIPALPSLSPKQKEAYTRAPGIHITDASAQKIFFTCLPGHAEGPLLDGHPSTLCASNAVLKSSDLSQAESLFNDQFRMLWVQKSCPVLMEASASPPSGATNTAKGGMTMQQLLGILRLAYHTTSFGDPTAPPFSYTAGAGSLSFADAVGFLSLEPGGAVWGLRCPEGAVVASDSSTMPYCRQIEAGREKTFYAFSGSMNCPDGSAVSGWYNLPGLPVENGSYGGPKNATGLRLYCRSTPLLSSCQQPTSPYCQGGGVVTSVSFDSNKFTIGCCKMQRRIGMALTSNPRRSQPYKDFAGYYCPIAMDITGAPSYVKTVIPSLGSPAPEASRPPTWTLTWNRWNASWELLRSKAIIASLPGTEESPVSVTVRNGSGVAFSATFIDSLTAAYVMGSKPKSAVPGQKPAKPKLLAFHSNQPDYKAYCDPAYLQNPYSYSAGGSISQMSPCWHTFNAMPAALQPAPKKPMLKGITEEAFWQCSLRSKRRSYMSTMNVVNKEKLANMMTNTDSTINEITLGLELAAAIVGMIPWGSYANPGEKGAEETQEQVRKNAIGNIEHEVEDEFQQVEQQAGQQVEKSFARKLLDGIKNFFGTTAQNIGSALFETLLNNDYSWLVAENSLKEYQSHRAGPTPPKAPSPGAMKNMTEELVRQTVPTLTGSYVKDLQSLADASWKDCLPLQFGLSKVMCDLFCIDDAVRSGTSAVLSSLQSSHQVLMTNLQSLLDYQTKYLLWAIGSIVSPKALWEVKQKQKGFEEEDFLSAPDLLQDLEELQEFPVKNHSMTDHLMLGREVLDWHEATADELMSRITAMFMNASEDNWPYRARAMKGMLHHYGKSLKEKISEAQMPLRQSHLGPSFAQKQIDGKLQLLSDQANQHREVAEVVQTLRMQPLEFHLEDQIVWNSILESFLHTHEKQDAFTMLHLKALDQTEDALNLAQNFSQCAGASSASLRESWQRALRADERSSEALLEAWSATITTAERLRIAVKDERFLERLPQHIDLEAGSAVLTASCQNHTALAQESYSQAVALVASSLQPLATQINTFKVLATYQEQQLRHRRLEYLAAPEAFMSSELTALLTTLSDPSTTLGRALAKRALKVLGNPRCPGEELLVEDVTLRAEPVKSLLMF